MLLSQLSIGRVWPIFMVMAVFGCSPGSSQQNSQDSRVSEDNVFSDQVKALEKAEKLESELQLREQSLRQSMEQQNP